MRSSPGWSAPSRQAPRPYHLVVLSDHGQSQGRPFRQRYGLELGELVEERTSAVATSTRRRRSDEGLSTVGGALTDARDEDNAGARMLARATRRPLGRRRGRARAEP